MKTNPNDPTAPCMIGDRKESGLTKREYFAARALQGYLQVDGIMPNEAAFEAVRCADALIEELNKPTEHDTTGN